MPETGTIGGDKMLALVAAVLRERGHEGWLVGGSVRDLQLGRESPDIDVVVTGDPRAIARDVARGLGLPRFTLSEEHEAYRVVGEVAHLDVAAVRGGSILSDLAQRDFTVNAMAMPIGAGGGLGDLVDPYGGLAHLGARRLVAVSERIFTDDPLRLMRAARFAHVLGLALTPPLRERMRAQAAEIKRAAPERVATEMILTLDAGRAGDAARLWHGLGLLHEVVPELKQLRHQDDLFSFLDSLEDMLGDPAGRFPNAAPWLERRLADPIDGAVERRTAVRLAGLLMNVNPNEAQKIGSRLKLSGAMISLIETAARMGRPGLLPRVLGSSVAPGREAVLFLWASAPWEPEVILLEAVSFRLGQSAAGDAAPTAAGRLIDAWAARAREGVPRPPFDGIALMRELGLEPGPRLGKALRAARLVWEAGEAITAEQALAAARAALDEG